MKEKVDIGNVDPIESIMEEEIGEPWEKINGISVPRKRIRLMKENHVDAIGFIKVDDFCMKCKDCGKVYRQMDAALKHRAKAHGDVKAKDRFVEELIK